MRTRNQTTRRVYAAVALLLVLALPGCAGESATERTGGATAEARPSAPVSRSPRPAERPAPGDHRLALDWQGQEREYELHAPPGYRPGERLPLVVVLHYRDGTPELMRQMTRFDAKADRERFLVAYPVGVGRAFNALGCCGDRDDVGFIRGMVEHLVTVWGVDAGRVYATGISVGAELTYRLAVEAPGTFAAIAPVSGGFIGSRAEDPSFKPSRPVSVISFIGNNDHLVNAMELGLRNWQRKLGCVEEEPVWADRDRTATRTPARCADGSEVIGYTVNSMGHAWPGGTDAGLGDPGTKIKAVDLIWAFFKAHPAGAR